MLFPYSSQVQYYESGTRSLSFGYHQRIDSKIILESPSQINLMNVKNPMLLMKSKANYFARKIDHQP